MTGSIMRFAMLLAALIAAWQPSKASAQDQDTQFWLNTIATGEIADGTTLTIDATQRWRGQDEVGADQQTLRVSVDQNIADRTRIGGGVILFDTAGLTEIRLHQQASFTLGRFESRTRLEERFFDDADQMELRLRQRVQYNQPIVQGWRGTAGVEWLGIMQSRDRERGSSTEQWRFQTSLVHRVSDNVDIGAIYWMVIFPRGDRPARTSHVPQAAITYRF